MSVPLFHLQVLWRCQLAHEHVHTISFLTHTYKSSTLFEYTHRHVIRRAEVCASGFRVRGILRFVCCIYEGFRNFVSFTGNKLQAEVTKSANVC